MQMIENYLVISGTNRSGSNTLKVAEQYRDLLQKEGVNVRMLSLESINMSERSSQFIELEKDWLIPTQKYVFVSPEYNGSIPGILKLMFDVSDYKKVWWGKKALLVGISTGRSGNVRGMEHLTSILNYLKVVVHPNKLPISSVDKLLNGSGKIHDSSTVSAISDQLHEFVQF